MAWGKSHEAEMRKTKQNTKIIKKACDASECQTSKASHGKSFRIDSTCIEKLVKDFKNTSDS